METNDRPLGWTMLEESKALVEAGLNPESADMCYIGNDSNGNWPKIPMAGSYSKVKNKRVEPICPCWSLGKLKSLLPREIDGCRWVTTPITGKTMSIAYEGGLGQTLCAKTRHTEIEAVVAMILDLLNKEYID